MHPQASARWRADIDGLRAVAVLAVVVYHAWPALLPGGFVGVDVFFVISGFLITGILLKEHGDGRFSLVRFYERRARRLFPALAAVLTVTVLMEFAFAHPFQVAQTAKQGIAAAFSTSNLVLWREAGYFDTSSRLKPLLNLWSLGVEEQFYLLWPVVLAVLIRTRWLLAVVVSICVVSLTTAELWNESHRAAAFYLPISRMWELEVGALLAIIVQRNTTSERMLDPRTAEVAVTIGMALVFGSMLWLSATTPFPGLSAVAPVLGTALVVWAGARSSPLGGPVSRVLTSRPFGYVGLHSYSLYLWHWPLLSLAATAALRLDGPARFGLVGLAFLLSMATVRWVESPARHAAVPRRAAVLSGVALLATALTCTIVYLHEEPVARRLAVALEWPAPEQFRQSCPAALRDLPFSLTYCRASGPSPASAVVWGDSHADHLFPGLVARDPGRGWILLGHPSCPPTSGIDVIADQPHCRERAEEALRWIEHQPSVETVVLGTFGHYADDTDVAQQHRDGPYGPSRTSINGSYDRASKTVAYADGLQRAVGRLVTAGKRVVIVIDVPELPVSATDCFMPPRVVLATPRCEVARAEVAARQATMRATIAAVAAQYPVVRVVDPLPVLCGLDSCGPGTALVPTYRDSHHLSVSGSARVADLILLAVPPLHTAGAATSPSE